MVQVDVFWAYGFGASLAVAVAPMIKKQNLHQFYNEYFVKTVLFLALIWSPTGLLLLLRHPSWESMQAAESLSSIPPWIVLAFGITNVTQGILGFWMGKKLMDSKRYFAAQINWMIGYFGLFFILLYGWDGLGYDRFLYDRDMLSGSPAWTPFVGTGNGVIEAIINFLKSGVFITLITDGVFLLPLFAYLYAKWQRLSYTQGQLPSPVRSIVDYTVCVFVAGLGSAALAALIVGLVAKVLNVGAVVWHAQGFYAPENLSMHVLSYVIGLPLAIFLIRLVLYSKGMPFHKLVSRLVFEEDK